MASVAALATLEYIENENVLGNVYELSGYFRGKLFALKERYKDIIEVRGIGLIWAIELTNSPKMFEMAEKIMYHCLENGLSFKVSHGHIIVLAPPLIITAPEIDAAAAILDEAFSKYLSN